MNNSYHFKYVEEAHFFEWMEGTDYKTHTIPCSECTTAKELVAIKRKLKRMHVPEELVAQFRRKLNFISEYKGG